jgi:anion-transporting  ArsA/GET3 family ATPase
VSKRLGFYLKLTHPLQTIKSLFGKAPKPKLLSAFEGLGQTADKIERMLSDARTEFILVLNPEKLSISEGKQLREAAEEHNITVKRAIVNKMILPCKCRFCALKREEQQRYLELIQREYGDLKLLTVPYLPYEIVTKKRIQEYARKLFEE